VKIHSDISLKLLEKELPSSAQL